MSTDQVIAPGSDPSASRRMWRRLAGLVAGVGTLIGLVTGAIAISDYLNRDTGPARFTESVDTPTGMRNFLAFADEHDSELVRLEFQCVYHEGPRSCVDQSDPIGQAKVLLDLNANPACDPDRQHPCDGSVVLFFFAKDVSEAQIDNGEFGAGSIVIRGYFTLSKRGSLGSLPPGVTAIYLTAVPAEQVPKAAR